MEHTVERTAGSARELTGYARCNEKCCWGTRRKRTGKGRGTQSKSSDHTYLEVNGGAPKQKCEETQTGRIVKQNRKRKGRPSANGTRQAGGNTPRSYGGMHWVMYSPRSVFSLRVRRAFNRYGRGRFGAIFLLVGAVPMFRPNPFWAKASRLIMPAECRGKNRLPAV